MFKKNIFVLFFSVLLILFGFCLATNTFFKENQIVVNGINLSEISKEEATEIFDRYIDNYTKEITLDIKYMDKVWSFNGSNFLPTSKIHIVLDDLYANNFFGDYTKKIKAIKQIKKMGFDNYIALNFTFREIDEKIDGIISEIEENPINSEITFNKTSETFNITKSKVGIKVDRDKLINDIIESIQKTKNAVVFVKTTEIKPDYTEEMLKKCTQKQATFSTNFSSSTAERKHNIALCTKKLNGSMISPLQVFSFNDIIGVRSEENGYKPAKIIKNGEFVSGVGGGICQVSTTLYNALLLSGIDVLEVHKHSLPVSYISPSLDAMVSWGSADLKFKNNTNLPIFISSKCDNDTITFSIYGDTKEKNVVIKTKSEIVNTIKSSDDKIIKDTDKKYIDKIMFKGEFLRVKPRRDGYESRAYLEYFIDGKLSNKKQIRSDRYEAQPGIIYEGTEDLIEGFVIPETAKLNEEIFHLEQN